MFGRQNETNWLLLHIWIVFCVSSPSKIRSLSPSLGLTIKQFCELPAIVAKIPSINLIFMVSDDYVMKILKLVTLFITNKEGK